MTEHKRATIAQIREGKGGRFFEVDSDVLEVVEQIGQIDEHLRVHLNQTGGYWYVNELCPDGKERLVTTAQELDQRLVTHLRRMLKPDWDPGAEMDRIDRERERRVDHETHESVGEKAEVLAHAVRKDLNPGKIVVPKGVSDAA